MTTSFPPSRSLEIIGELIEEIFKGETDERIVQPVRRLMKGDNARWVINSNGNESIMALRVNLIPEKLTQSKIHNRRSIKEPINLGLFEVLDSELLTSSNSTSRVLNKQSPYERTILSPIFVDRRKALQPQLSFGLDLQLGRR